MPAFHEVRFPELISWGAAGGQGWLTSVVDFSTGKEQRNQEWTIDRGQWDVAHGVKTQTDLDELADFFAARRGRAHGFRYKDWSGFRLVDELLQNSADDTFVGDNSTTLFNVVRIYEQTSPPPASTSVNPYIKRVFKLRGGAGDDNTILTEAVKLDGVVQDPGDYTVDRDAGTITFDTAPGTNVVPTITAEYDLPARFDVDRMVVRIEDFNAFTWDGIIVKEINPLLEPS